MILDAGGGTGRFANIVRMPDYVYVVIDKDQSRLAQGVDPPRQNYVRVCGDVTNMPFAEETFRIIISVSVLQYLDHDRFFEECHRVLTPEGVLAIHENGPYNPIILAARLMQRVLGVFSRRHWVYRNTIRRYYRTGQVPVGFEPVYRDASCLFTAALLGLSSIRIPVSDRVLSAIEAFDMWLFGRWPVLRKLAFFNIIHFRKVAVTDR